MTSLQYILPIILLLLAFLLKLLIDQTANLPLFVRAIAELPVDVAFLAISFVAAYAIKASDRIDLGLIYFCVYLVGSVVVVLLWRRSLRLFEVGHYVSMVFFAFLNYALCIFGLQKALQLLCGGQA